MTFVCVCARVCVCVCVCVCVRACGASHSRVPAIANPPAPPGHGNHLSSSRDARSPEPSPFPSDAAETPFPLVPPRAPSVAFSPPAPHPRSRLVRAVSPRSAGASAAAPSGPNELYLWEASERAGRGIAAVSAGCAGAPCAPGAGGGAARIGRKRPRTLPPSPPRPRAWAGFMASGVLLRSPAGAAPPSSVPLPSHPPGAPRARNPTQVVTPPLTTSPVLRDGGVRVRASPLPTAPFLRRKAYGRHAAFPETARSAPFPQNRGKRPAADLAAGPGGTWPRNRGKPPQVRRHASLGGAAPFPIGPPPSLDPRHGAPSRSYRHVTPKPACRGRHVTNAAPPPATLPSQLPGGSPGSESAHVAHVQLSISVAQSAHTRVWRLSFLRPRHRSRARKLVTRRPFPRTVAVSLRRRRDPLPPRPPTRAKRRLLPPGPSPQIEARQGREPPQRRGQRRRALRAQRVVPVGGE